MHVVLTQELFNGFWWNWNFKLSLMLRYFSRKHWGCFGWKNTQSFWFSTKMAFIRRFLTAFCNRLKIYILFSGFSHWYFQRGERDVIFEMVFNLLCSTNYFTDLKSSCSHRFYVAQRETTFCFPLVQIAPKRPQKKYFLSPSCPGTRKMYLCWKFQWKLELLRHVWTTSR